MGNNRVTDASARHILPLVCTNEELRPFIRNLECLEARRLEFCLLVVCEAIRRGRPPGAYAQFLPGVATEPGRCTQEGPGLVQDRGDNACTAWTDACMREHARAKALNDARMAASADTPIPFS